MYESHFGLNKKPFQITTDPNFLWMGTKHREALNTLTYGVMDNKGLLLLTGDVGTGKTTLINRLMEDIRDKAYTAKIPDPRLTKYDFYRMVSRYFKLPIEVRTKSDFIEPFSRFLRDAHHEKKAVLLLIDEAQRLKHDLMEEIRLLSNLEHKDVKLLNIFFVGQNEFNSTLLQPENRPLMRRITITYNIDPLNQEETGQYIRHRLKVAGADTDIFSTGATEEVFDFSNGFPRQINIISDLAMFFASQSDQHKVSRKVVRQCRERISFSITEVPAAPTRRRPTAAVSPVEPATADVSRRSAVTPFWLVIAVALLLVSGAVVYFTPPDWISRARQWIHQTDRSGRETTGLPVKTAAPDRDAATAPEPTAETITSAVPTEQSVPFRSPDLPMPMPLQPPGPSTRKAASAASPPEIRPDHQASQASPSPSADAISASPSQPDPADAVEWVLRNRYRDRQP